MVCMAKGQVLYDQMSVHYIAVHCSVSFQLLDLFFCHFIEKQHSQVEHSLDFDLYTARVVPDSGLKLDKRSQ